MLGLPCYIDYHVVQLVSDKTYIFLEDDIPSSRYVEFWELDWEKINPL